LTAWAVGAVLIQQPFGLAWWIGFALGSSLIMLVVVAEYITADPQDIRRAPAIIGLTAVAFALYLILAMLVRARGTRFFITVPTLTIAAALVGLRVLLLQFPGRQVYLHKSIIMLISGETAAALYYLPLPPTAFALALVGLTYSLVNLAGGMVAEKQWQQFIIEPLIVLAFTWAVAAWLI